MAAPEGIQIQSGPVSLPVRRARGTSPKPCLRRCASEPIESFAMGRWGYSVLPDRCAGPNDATAFDTKDCERPDVCWRSRFCRLDSTRFVQPEQRTDGPIPPSDSPGSPCHSAASTLMAIGLVSYPVEPRAHRCRNHLCTCSHVSDDARRERRGTSRPASERLCSKWSWPVLHLKSGAGPTV